MSEAEQAIERFLERWSRRKRAATQQSGAAAAGEEQLLSPSDHAGAAPLPAASAAAADEAPAEFDPASLPPIDSINAVSDVRGFLAAGVPVELTRAALRRAWVADPAIRDFIGIAENQWDFSRPDGVPGFGALEWTEELRRLAAELLGDVAPEAAEAQPGDPAVASEAPEKTEESAICEVPPTTAAESAGPAASKDQPSRTGSRRHGGALPT